MAHRDNSASAPAIGPLHHTTGGPEHLRADGVSHAYGDLPVLSGVSIVVDPAERLGLIGENGAGKSTLLRILAGVEVPDAGLVSRPASVGLLWQELPAPDSQTIGALLDDALAPARAAVRELEEAALALAGPPAGEDAGTGAGATGDTAARYANALERAERLDVWAAEARRDEVLAGLGLAALSFERRLGEVSGGQRSRLALAALLLRAPTALVLDEPTNHLDDDAVDYLRRAVVNWRGPVVFASHDRAFLDDVATTVVDIDPGATSPARRYGGGFSDYLAVKAAERGRWQQHYEAEQQELVRLRAAVDITSRQVSHAAPRRDNEKMNYGTTGNRVQAQIGRRVRDARGRLDALTASQTPKPPAPLSFAGMPHGAHPLPDDAGPLLVLDGARIDGRLASVSIAVEPRSRILVTGANGAGKSTLLGVLAGRGAGGGANPGAGVGLETVDSGTVSRRRGLRVGLLTQDVRFADPDASPRVLYRRALGEAAAERIPLASLGLLAPRDLDRAAGALSVGQQRRLALAIIVAKPPHLFLLDEPTNHLSLGLAGELEDAFGDYPGAVVVASHDRWLRRRWNGEVLALRGASAVEAPQTARRGMGPVASTGV
ncbi:ABC-F family ATP-binding cassette domain-containing protein [Herbiconiux sp. 11R-BC]|uniref:ABC-F family ATP-binding cassette domain-containing protein n=1 Tax=Herbiconiux sp. 11R-BC TaxID=3111637 RepID=UPI003C00FCBF